MSLKLNTASGGSITLQEADTASNLTLTVPAQSATLATLTTPSFATTIGVGGATPAASGSGITFPATQSGSSDANTLDDYEEGTWTTSLSNYTNTTSQAASDLKYIKIGKQVILQGKFSITVTSANTLTGWIFTLPFARDAAADAQCGSVNADSDFSVGIVSNPASTTTNSYAIFKSVANLNAGVNLRFDFSYSYIASA